MNKVYKTPEVERQYIRIFKETAKKFGRSVALETMRQFQEAEDKLARGSAFPKHDPDYHSQRFEYITIQNSQTLFFERLENDIVIVAVGWSGRNWKERLEEMQLYIDRQLEKFKKLNKK